MYFPEPQYSAGRGSSWSDDRYTQRQHHVSRQLTLNLPVVFVRHGILQVVGIPRRRSKREPARRTELVHLRHEVAVPIASTHGGIAAAELRQPLPLVAHGSDRVEPADEFHLNRLVVPVCGELHGGPAVAGYVIDDGEPRQHVFHIGRALDRIEAAPGREEHRDRLACRVLPSVIGLVAQAVVDDEFARRRPLVLDVIALLSVALGEQWLNVVGLRHVVGRDVIRANRRSASRSRNRHASPRSTRWQTACRSRKWNSRHGCRAFRRKC